MAGIWAFCCAPPTCICLCPESQKSAVYRINRNRKGFLVALCEDAGDLKGIPAISLPVHVSCCFYRSPLLLCLQPVPISFLQVCLSYDHTSSHVTRWFSHSNFSQVPPLHDVAPSFQPDRLHPFCGGESLHRRRTTSAPRDSAAAAWEVRPPPSAIQLLSPQCHPGEQQPATKSSADRGGWGVRDHAGVRTSTGASKETYQQPEGQKNKAQRPHFQQGGSGLWHKLWEQQLWDRNGRWKNRWGYTIPEHTEPRGSRSGASHCLPAGWNQD